MLYWSGDGPYRLEVTASVAAKDTVPNSSLIFLAACLLAGQVDCNYIVLSDLSSYGVD